MEFFNISKWSTQMVDDSIIVKPDTLFSISLFILDSLMYKEPQTVTASLQKVVGRTKTMIPTVVTVTKSKTNLYNISATPVVTDWSGTEGLNLILTINSDEMLIHTLVVGV